MIRRVAIMIIQNRHLVEDYFGYWPEFCDAKVINLRFNAEKKFIEISLRYFDVDRNLGAEITIGFLQCLNLNFSSFCMENVVDNLTISIFSESFHVVIDSSFGLSGDLHCQEVEVVSIERIKVPF